MSAGELALLPCTGAAGDFRGWRAVYLRNGMLTVVAVPDIGGRLMAFDLADYSYLYVERALQGKLFSAEENLGDGSLAAWKNYGGDKTWPAPQGWDNEQQWHGPPDPVLDTGRYHLQGPEITDDVASLEMTSPPDARTGLRIGRRVTIFRGSSRLTLDLTFTNISRRPIRWSIWDVVQLQAEQQAEDGSLLPDTTCVVTAPLNPHSRFERGFQVMFGDEDNPQWQVDEANGLFVGRYLCHIGKVGIDSPGGWIAFCNERLGYAFVERFAYDALAEYPDDGATVECWTTGKGTVGNLSFENSHIYHMETEVLSPLFDFRPGQHHGFRIEWGACRLPSRVVDVQPGGCSARRLKTLRRGNGLAVEGLFGVFDYAQLYLLARNAAGDEVARVALGPATPLEPVELETRLDVPDSTASVELLAVAVADGQERLVARAQANG